ncbi:MAG TPA: ribonuclease P protein component 4 [Methanolinea sp.]|mgnify:FL=1|jgi:ribonuclease P protein subunit RPR2|nr:ribonuclease P protein component 4 [Methanolinea sp.]MDI6898465.1 ribonuclease P protein component 4 [Methanolinea sp.]HOS81602.1 ribonuclease P protein component 4 [Methanolinea sp.]HPC54501.1 ribonuclease P protein component 4 [Methanolinea sp.]HQE84975.1 ribonuclease P protein component 4 [Methanolinea sp.]
MSRRTAHPEARRIARERIAILFEQARKAFPLDPALADRYVSLARKISMKHRVRLDREFRRQFCHHCHRFLAPGANARVRIYRGRVTVTCLACHRQMRYPLRRRS